MTGFNPQVAHALTALISNLTETSPEMTDILAKVKNGEIDETTAMTWLMETVMGDPALAAKFQTMAMGALAPLKGVDTQFAPQTMFVPRGGAGVPRMNPLYEAALVERAQFDEDMPELRTGDIPAGMTPAVPVKTKAHDPVSIGVQLQKAATQVQRELTDNTKKRQQLVASAIAGDASALAVISQHGALVGTQHADAIVRGTASDDPAGYRRGELPELRTVQRPRASTLAKMSDVERKEAAWKFLSTTQGRRSAVDLIRQLVAKELGKKGLMVEERTFDPKESKGHPLAYKEWSLMMSGPGALQPAFALVDVASKSLSNGLVQSLQNIEITEVMYLEVEAINEVDARTVGWMARLMPHN